MVEPPVPDSLAVAQYSCLYWVDHLLDCDRGHTTNDLKDGGSVHQFLKTSYIFWLEAHSLMKSLPDGIVMIMKLENRIKVSYNVILRIPLEKTLLIRISSTRVLMYMRLYMMQGGLPYTID
jgi:hypothetical protein